MTSLTRSWEVCQTELLKRFIKIVKKQIIFGSTSLERKAKAKKKKNPPSGLYAHKQMINIFTA